MIKISCLCGHADDYRRFIPHKQVDRWLHCPVCKIKFSSPCGILEVGIQIVDENGRSEFIPEPANISEQVNLDLRIWQRDDFLKSREAVKEIQEVFAF